MIPSRTAALICAAGVLLLAASCSPVANTPAVAASITLQNVQLQPVQTGTDKQAVNNCGGTDDATYTIAKEREISHQLEVASELSLSADGSVKVLGTGIALGAAVASKVGATYGKRDTVGRTIEINVQPKTMVEYEVSLQDVYEAGEAEITVGNQKTTIPFRFFDDFVLVLLGTRELPCLDTATAVPTYTVDVATDASVQTEVSVDTTVAPTTTVTPDPPAPVAGACRLPNGNVISGDSLAAQIGGDPAHWTYRGGHCVWGYWNKEVITTFRHPGGNTILTYWSGYAEPRNTGGCWVAVPEPSGEHDGKTRVVQCPDAGAEFEADGVGFHPYP
jgi:hypothetical protein